MNGHEPLYVLPAVKNDSKNSAAIKKFSPSCFDSALVSAASCSVQTAVCGADPCVVKEMFFCSKKSQIFRQKTFFSIFV